MDDLIPAWVDGVLTPVGKLAAHQQGLRHMAVSVFVLCGDRVLIQRRALGKYHTPGLWANSCCTHPHWQEDAATCAHRRLDQELGLRHMPITPAGTVEYRADVGGGLVEHEVVDLFVARLDTPVTPAPNADEVMDTAWITLSDLRADLIARPERYTPWLRIYMDQHADQIFGAA
ncbi:MAG: isopentenyl-diphosphate Delta-isomerase [Rhodovulum sp.]|jgi:isopentenyl-diphosphate delta-isomerase|nr:isopentenyl-diphosphate delta-isomerase [Rhodovulum sp.]MCI5084768.1 isopentenyl-diphosphate Delta-isomerase [Rhodovulum sp.]MEC8629686.1 isopentenyl-diphosphate Delta-isomerase [Pseudomonadota bacterium]|tara:strand:- start:707 stop:1228 length:522 start_codon:yes stop_codon:yes gene_type:complete